MTPDERAKRAAVVLDAWADAIRGDWGTIDGRACRDELHAISDFLRGSTDSLTFTDVGVCRCNGYTHWHGDAWDTKCPDDAVEVAEP